MTATAIEDGDLRADQVGNGDKTPEKYKGLDYHDLNALLNLVDEDGNIQFDADVQAARQYHLQHINPNTVFFHDLEEKIDFLVDNEYYEKEVFDQYDWQDVKDLFKYAYSFKFRFPTFLGAFKFYSQYALKTFDGKRYLERFEDRVVMNGLYLAQGDVELARNLIREIITGAYQPATPTFLNSGKKQRGEMVSCFLILVDDDLESIGRSINSALQLSKRGGGVALCLTDLRGAGDPIKHVEGASSGVVPVMKILEDSFKYANQIGARNGAGATYLHAHHIDVMEYLDTKRENADESIRIKTLSLGLVIPDITYQLARKNEDMYLFSPYDVRREYGIEMSKLDVTENYWDMVDNPRIRKKKVKAREFFQQVATIQFESGYPYIMNFDTVNRANPIDGVIRQSNLCVTGDTRLLTSEGYKRADDLYASQEDIKVQTDERARLRDLDKLGEMSIQDSTKMFKTGVDQDVYKIETLEGFEIKATAYHKFYVDRDGEVVEIPLSELELGDRLLVQGGKSKSFGSYHNPELAYLWGAWVADGTIAGNERSKSVRIDMYGDKDQFADRIEECAAKVLKGRDDLLERQATLEPKAGVRLGDNPKTFIHSAPLYKLFVEHGMTEKVAVPEWLWTADEETQAAFIDGVWAFDGCITGNRKVGSISIELGSIEHKFLQDMQTLLLTHGIYTRIYKSRKAPTMTLMPDGRGGVKEYLTQASWTLRAMDRGNREALHDLVNWRATTEAYWQERLAGIKSNRYVNHHKNRATIASIEYAGKEDVYDVTVENGHVVTFVSFVTSQCVEVLQVSEHSEMNEDGTYAKVGKDISCNLGSMNIAKAIDGGNLEQTIEVAMRGLSAVSEMSNISSVPPVDRGNQLSHAVGLGQMNLHGFLAREHIHYGSEKALEIVDAYFMTVAYYAYKASNKLAIEKGESFYKFEDSDYADGSYFNKYIGDEEYAYDSHGYFEVPSKEDWQALAASIVEYGLYNQNLQAIPPTGSISYINGSTSSIHPIASAIETRKEGKLGRVYYPAAYMNMDNLEYYKDAYELGPEKLIDTYAMATKHVDQGLSCTLFLKAEVSTREVNKAQIYAWRKGLKTLYYIRLRQLALDGTAVAGTAQECIACAL